MPMTHVAESLRFIMRKLAESYDRKLCAFCSMRPGTHRLLVDGEFPVDCCDHCDDAEPSELLGV